MNAGELPVGLHRGREVLGDLEQAERREWWLTNGRGAYAAGTLALSLTRRYHGLLVAPVSPPLGRVLVAAKADATLVDGERSWPLFTNRWRGGAVAPAGHVHMESFRLEGRMPVWRFALGDLSLEQRIWMEPGRDVTHLAWRLLGAARPGLALHLDLLVNARDHHGVTWPGGLDPRVEGAGAELRVVHPDGLTLNARAHGGDLSPDGVWVEGFDLPLERERGLEDTDHHLRAGRAHLPLVPGQWSGLTLGLGELPGDPPAAALERWRRRGHGLLARAEAARPALARAPDWVRRLVLSADDFIFARPLAEVPDGESVIAGYPWFGDWGRDTMIALPGLTLATGRVASARRILETFARFVDGGMLPNMFPGAGGRADYNTVDAALWYLEAWRAYLEATGDEEALRGVYPVLEEIVAAYRDGTRYGIRVDPADALVSAGEAGVQLTWMDAKVGDWVVTPRQGKAVEINALWHHGLEVMADFAARVGADGQPYRELAEGVRAGFARFAGGDGGGLKDVVDGPQGDDPALRPNQILAVSLPHSPLAPADRPPVVAACGRELLTSYGLRSLAPGHRDYRGTYRGGVRERDGAYHQGTVWAWLLGHYALAEHRVTGDRARALARLEPVAEHLADAAVGSISEVFDGDPPHHPRGAPVQAWSVACILEAWVRLSDPS